MTFSDQLSQVIRTIPDFPKPGIQFKDITPILQDPALLRATADALAEPYRNRGIEKVVGIESRGFLFALMIAERLDAGFVPVRKPGKLPATTIQASYALEYGFDTLEMHADALKANERVLIHDDVLATGGTAEAVAGLVTQLGANVIGYSFLIELGFLNGRDRIRQTTVQALIRY